MLFRSIIETYNALKRKKIVDPTNLDTIVTMFLNTATVQAIEHGVITNALLFKHKYQLSFLDSIIVASAIQSNSSILYSEDMHHGLVIEETLSIINPFV